ncbi:MAG TPA: helix-hairpin-helix domain-containing protein [Thermoanaerobaculia bacterium]|nr:helix-hairpin-helix domain-containing protein [Thermoanaerobaculia bacterium]
MRKSLHILAATVLAIATLTTSLHADAAPAGKASSAGVININTADASQFALLPRVGVKAGERIVAYRKDNGAFKATTDLMQVKGIGDKSFELLSSYLTVDGKTTLSSKQRAPRKPRSAKAAGSRPQSSPQAQ